MAALLGATATLLAACAPPATTAPPPARTGDDRLATVSDTGPVGRASKGMFGDPNFLAIEDAECIVEARLIHVYSERYNTDSGQEPVEGDLDPRYLVEPWVTYIPLRFEVERVIWCDRPLDGFVDYQQRERYPPLTPPALATLSIGLTATWCHRPETLYHQPTGLAFLMFREDPPVIWDPDMEPPYPTNAIDRYMVTMRADLRSGGDAIEWARNSPWYEYIHGTALSLCGLERELPIADLLAEVHEGLRLLGRE